MPARRFSLVPRAVFPSSMLFVHFGHDVWGGVCAICRLVRLGPLQWGSECWTGDRARLGASAFRPAAAAGGNWAGAVPRWTAPACGGHGSGCSGGGCGAAAVGSGC